MSVTLYGTWYSRESHNLKKIEKGNQLFKKMKESNLNSQYIVRCVITVSNSCLKNEGVL